MKKGKKILIISLSSILGLVLISIASFLIYANIYYKAESEALSLLKSENVIDKDDYIFIETEDKTDTLIIFYPGAKVEAEAYLPLLVSLNEEGYDIVLIRMPLRMAIFKVNAADDIIEQYQDEYANIYIAGHSMGGAMASSYASKNPSKVKGLILLGSYIYGNYSPKDTLTIYGSLNQSVEDNLTYTENVVEIEGGNHAQFGNYGHQKGDAIATISALEQQKITIDAIVRFISNKE